MIDEENEQEGEDEIMQMMKRASKGNDMPLLIPKENTRKGNITVGLIKKRR